MKRRRWTLRSARSSRASMTEPGDPYATSERQHKAAKRQAAASEAGLAETVESQRRSWECWAKVELESALRMPNVTWPQRGCTRRRSLRGRQARLHPSEA